MLKNRDLMLSVPMGRRHGADSINKFGANTDVGSGTTEDIWDGGGTYTFPTTADITHVSQATDQESMRGQSVEIQGLDIDWNAVTQTVTLDASNTSTAVALTTPLFRVSRMKVVANVVADPAISLKNVGGGTTYAVISAGLNQTLMAIYPVPAGYTAYMTQYYGDYVRDAIKDPDSVEINLMAADRASGYEFQIKHKKGIPKQAAGFRHEFLPYYKFTEKTDTKLRATPSGAAASVHGGFDLILIAN